MIKLAPIVIDNNSRVDFETKFIINDILPVAINQPTEEIPFYTILFCCHQDIRDLYMYLQVPFIFSNQDEEKAIRKKKCYIERIKENTEAYKEYVDITINMRIENLYTTDFDYISFIDKPYYKFQAIRRVGQGIYYRREIQITRLNWLFIQMFLDELFYDLYWNGKFFTDPYYLSPKWVKVDHVIYDAATRRDINGHHMIMNHYIIGCGPTEYKINWITPDKDTSKVLRRSLHIKIYQAEYSHHPTVTDVIFDDKSKLIYILVKDPNKLAILKLDEEMTKLTNFADVYNGVYEEENIK